MRGQECCPCRRMNDAGRARTVCADLLIFPPWLQHAVDATPATAEGPRISVSFKFVTQKGLEPPRSFVDSLLKEQRVRVPAWKLRRL